MAALDGILFRWSPKRVIDGMPVAVVLFSSAEERNTAFGRISDALALLERYAPIRYGQIKRDIGRILVSAAVPTAYGTYDEASRTCALLFDWMMAPDTSPEDIAGTIVHEAQHGRLFRLGFGYGADVRGRVERLCFRATRISVRRLPNAERVLARAEAGMTLSNDAYSAISHLTRERTAIRELKLPGFVKAGLLWMNGRRAAQVAKHSDLPASGRGHR